MTSDLPKRIWEHRNHVVPGFTQKYRIHRLVYFEMHSEVQAAIRREKSIKRWTRQMKMHAIEKDNPDWEDLYHDLNQSCHPGHEVHRDLAFPQARRPDPGTCPG